MAGACCHLAQNTLLLLGGDVSDMLVTKAQPQLMHLLENIRNLRDAEVAGSQ